MTVNSELISGKACALGQIGFGWAVLAGSCADVQRLQSRWTHLTSFFGPLLTVPELRQLWQRLLCLVGSEAFSSYEHRHQQSFSETS